MLYSRLKGTRENVTIGQDFGALSLAAVLKPTASVFASVLTDLHALSVAKVVLPAAIVNVAITADCELSLPMPFSL